MKKLLTTILALMTLSLSSQNLESDLIKSLKVKTFNSYNFANEIQVIGVLNGDIILNEKSTNLTAIKDLNARLSLFEYTKFEFEEIDKSEYMLGYVAKIYYKEQFQVEDSCQIILIKNKDNKIYIVIFKR